MVLFGTGVLSLSLFAILASRNSEAQKVDATSSSTDMDDVAPVDGEYLDKANMFFDGFDYGINTEDWSTVDQKWGNAYNSGVRHENVFYNSGEGSVTFRALGGQYTDDEFVNTNAEAYTSNGSYTGGVLASNFGVGPGRFETRMRIPAIKGACYALWTYNYGETDYSEIDIELPVRQYDNDSGENIYRFDEILCSTYTAEGTYTTDATDVIDSLADGEYHTFSFEWYHAPARLDANCVRWFVDGQLVKTISSNVPEYSARIWIGVWVPNDQYSFGLSQFDKAYMDVDYVKYTPFINQTYTDLGQGKDIHGTNKYGGELAIADRNYLPNDKFNNDSLVGYGSTENVTLSIVYDNSDDQSSYGIKVSPTQMDYIMYLKGEDNMVFSADYKGYGEISLTFYSLSADPVVTNLVGGHFSPSEYVHSSVDVVVPVSAHKAKVTIYTESSDHGIYVDNLFFGQHIAFEENQATPLFKDSYSASTHLYKDPSVETWGDHNINFGGDSKNWCLVNGNYFGDELALSNTDAIANASSGVEGAIKDCMITNDLFNLAEVTGDKFGVSAIYQDFDVNYFKDIVFGFKSFSHEDVWRKISILYSTDGGQSYNLLKTSMASEGFPKTEDSLFIRPFKASSDDLSLVAYTKIRFAFVGTNNDPNNSYLLTSIVINNYINLVNKLNAEGTCSYNTTQRAMLQSQYGFLSSDEITALESTKMTNYNQSFKQGYQYLLTYWSKNGVNSSAFDLLVNDKNNSSIIIIVVASVLAASLAFVFMRRKQK